ncbi:MAG: hypothetical protein ABEJ72_05905, partial [Candidatus Aenigmatarchaeota archaeon]
ESLVSEEELNQRLDKLEDGFENKLTSLEEALEKYIDERLSEERTGEMEETEGPGQEVPERSELRSEIDRLKKEVSSLKKRIQREDRTQPIILE